VDSCWSNITIVTNIGGRLINNPIKMNGFETPTMLVHPATEAVLTGFLVDKSFLKSGRLKRHELLVILGERAHRVRRDCLHFSPRDSTRLHEYWNKMERPALRGCFLGFTRGLTNRSNSVEYWDWDRPFVESLGLFPSYPNTKPNF